MVLKYIKSIWQSNYISQAKTEVTTFIDTADEQLQSLKPSLKEGTDIFFTNFLGLMTALLWSITLLVTLSIILIYGLAILLAQLVTKVIKSGLRE
jgi:hypothetical protein